ATPVEGTRSRSSKSSMRTVVVWTGAAPAAPASARSPMIVQAAERDMGTSLVARGHPGRRETAPRTCGLYGPARGGVPALRPAGGRGRRAAAPAGGRRQRAD